MWCHVLVIRRMLYLVVSLLSRCLFLAMYSIFFFFKQKTAYEMRISDWSSDVCSSDHRRRCARRGLLVLHASGGRELGQGFDRHGADGLCRSGLGHTAAGVGRLSSRSLENPRQTGLCDDVRPRSPGTERLERSEEHTSELQSLMRISYAVFCL